MKAPVLLLSVSLAANAALVGALAWRTMAPAGNPPSVTVLTAGPVTAAAASVEPLPPAPPLWSGLHAENLDEFSRRLRAAGFPAKTVRRLLAGEIFEYLESKRTELFGTSPDAPYWKAAGSVVSPDRRQQMEEFYRETRELEYKYIRGPDALAENEEAQVTARRRFGNLPLEKLQQLVALEHDFEGMRDKISPTSSSVPDLKTREAYFASLQALDREKEEQLAKMLTPAELEQYELRTNGGYLAQQLTAFKPTEDEFKAIYALEKSLRTKPDPAITPAQAMEEYELRLATVLGPERALDYLEIKKAGSDRLPLLVSRLNLPLSTIGSINRVKDDISQRAQAVSNDASLTAAQRESQLTALAREANEKLTSTLGSQRGYEAYMDLKGDWVRSLQPKRK
jgi:hypothetical protein